MEMTLCNEVLEYLYVQYWAISDTQ